MKVILSPTYFLTDERDEPFNGQPVLVNQKTGGVFGPGDMIKPYGNWNLEYAEAVVKKIASWSEHSPEEQEFIHRFRLVV